MDRKYKELIYKGETLIEKYQIEEILVKEKLSWFINSETANAKIEISNGTLIFNGGTWYTGIWYFGAWRAGEWKFGSWEDGVWFNGNWQDGIFKNGIIFNGTFFQGQFLNARLRKMNQDGSETRQDFINCDISPNVKKV